MYNYRKDSYEQRVEIMRRCTANALDEGDVWSWDAGSEKILEDLFLTNHGITEIAYYLNIPETAVMVKVLEMKLYGRYDFPEFHRWCGDDEDTPEDRRGAAFNSDPCTRAIEMLRRDTLAFDESRFVWDAERVENLRRKFIIAEGITEIALALGCTEPMVLNKILEEGLYYKMNYPMFFYCQ